MAKDNIERLSGFFTRNLILFLGVYFFVLLLLARHIFLGTMGILVIPIIILSTLRWKLKGGLISFILVASFICFSYFFVRKEGYLHTLVGAVLTYFLIAIILGLIVIRIERQQLRFKDSEKLYRDLYEQFRNYLDLVQVMIVALDKEGKVAYVNCKACEILGYKEEDIVGKNWFDNFIPENNRKEIKSVFERVIRGELKSVEYYDNPVLTRDGRERIIAWHNTLLFDELGNAIGSLSAGEDVTDLRILERQNQERLRNLGILYDAARDLITEDLDVYKRAQIATRICIEDFGVDLAWIGYREPDGRINVIAQYPQDHPYTKDLIVRWDETPFGQGPVGRSIRTGIPQIIEDTATDHRFEPWRDKALRYGFHTVGAFPLLNKNNIFGTLILYSKQYKYFTLERKDLLYTFAHLTASALENARLFTDIQKEFRKIQSLHTIDTTISGSLDLEVILNTALNEVIRQLNVDAVSVLLYNPSISALEYVFGQGFTTNLIKDTVIKIGEGLAGLVALERRTIKISNLEDFLIEFNVKVYSESIKNGFKDFIMAEKFVVYYGVPLVSKGQLLGVLEIFNRSPIKENKEWEEFLDVLAGQIAIGIDNVKLFQNLEESNIKLVNAYEETIEGWAYVLDLRDKETEGHSQRVADLTVRIAEDVGISKEELIHIRRGALLHDIGKIAIPDSILLKPERLTEEEWGIMKKHPIYAYQILSRIEYLRPAIDIPYCHHEKWDGSGYPRGLGGEEIPLSARVFAVADVFDALTSNRPYRKAWSRESALEYIKKERGRHFDPKVVEEFLKIIED